MKLSKTFIFLLLPLGLGAQTKVNLGTQGKNADFSNYPYTKPFQTGSSLPGTCSPFSAFVLTTAMPGQNLYLCTSTNTWTLQSGSGSGPTIPSVTNLLSGNGIGGVVDSTLVPGSVVLLTATQSLTNKTVDGITPTEFAFMDATSSIQTQLNNKLSVTGVAANSSQWGGAPITGVPTVGTVPVGTGTGAIWGLNPASTTSIGVGNPSVNIGSEPILNFIPTTGMLQVCVDNPTNSRIDCTPSPDPSYYLTRTTDQAGTGKSLIATSATTISGMVSTASNAVTWVSGSLFNHNQAGHAITINGTNYTVAFYNSSLSLTLSSSAGTQTNVAYSQTTGGGTYVAGTVPTISGYTNNQTFNFVPDFDCVGNDTLNIQGLGPVQIRKLIFTGPTTGAPFAGPSFGGSTQVVEGDCIAGFTYQIDFYAGSGVFLLHPTTLPMANLPAPYYNMYQGGLWAIGGPFSQINANHITVGEVFDSSSTFPSSGGFRSITTFEVNAGAFPYTSEESIFNRRNAANFLIDVPTGGPVGSVAAISGYCRTASSGCIGQYSAAETNFAGLDVFAGNDLVTDANSIGSGIPTNFAANFLVDREFDMRVFNTGTVQAIGAWILSNGSIAQPGIYDASAIQIYNPHDLPGPVGWVNGYNCISGGVTNNCLYMGQTTPILNGTVTTSGSTVTWATGDKYTLLAGIATLGSTYAAVVTINGTNYTVQSITDDTHFTTSTSVGTNASPVSFSTYAPSTSLQMAASNGGSTITATEQFVPLATNAQVQYTVPAMSSWGWYQASEPIGQLTSRGYQTVGLSGFAGSYAIPTVTGGCSATLGTGSTNLAGFIISGTSGTCNFTLTNGAAVSYATGMVCSFVDITTLADKNNVVEVSYGNTFVVASGVTASADNIIYQCEGF